MADLLEVKVPDIGDFKGVEVIEVLVKAGDRVKKEQSLISLESDKATMEIPSPGEGVVRDIAVNLGDKVSEGSLILHLETAPAAAAAPAAPAAPAAAPVVASGKAADIECDMLVLGAGPGGYSAAFRAADLGLKTVLVERYPVLGGVCLNVGCIPSKALLHTAAVVDAARAMAAHGITFGEPAVDLAKLRGFKDKVVGKLTGGLASVAKMRKVTVVEGVGQFVDPHHLEAGGKRIRFANAIIAAGSQAAKLPFLPEDPRIVDSTGALELRAQPKRLLVIAGGIIGLEMGTVYSTLGARLDVVEMLDGLMTGADRDLVSVWQKFNARRFDRIMLKTKTTKVEAKPDGLHVAFEGAEPAVYDMILVSVGRVPNGRNVGADKAGVTVGERGFIPVDSQMRTNVPHIYAIGDVTDRLNLTPVAIGEGHALADALFNPSGRSVSYENVPTTVFSQPNLGTVGLPEAEARKKHGDVEIYRATFRPMKNTMSGSAEQTMMKLVVAKSSQKVMGLHMVGPDAGEIVQGFAVAIKMGATKKDFDSTVGIHPTAAEELVTMRTPATGPWQAPIKKAAE